ncbi:hypothetical protein B0T26DRAFT_332644 [Lasiosphaeria miniovina]|uniref:Secreted protein n=1 Tax=Lasiosphaeria miniovina TaxID=1954250 RepID=A0AA40AMG9_9PEZI|nr:uncharacterized protein B0T26DRAFT_332644 [Lasiosphaeria miniovina]KAK0718524.1 hypothetical protein B0T26DRAFT_332644 [Lasiosphaeria miniovina]
MQVVGVFFTNHLSGLFRLMLCLPTANLAMADPIVISFLSVVDPAILKQLSAACCWDDPNWHSTLSPNAVRATQPRPWIQPGGC